MEVETAKTDDVAPEAAGAPIPEAPKAVVTVAAPVKGCPMPDSPEADIRASRVLESFLAPAQRSNYLSTGAFVTRGADTDRRYMVANRERPGIMARQMAYRQLFDLDNSVPICVHDWSVPPPEEMLALLLCLSIPGRENKLLMLPEIDPDLAMVDVDPRYRPREFR